MFWCRCVHACVYAHACMCVLCRGPGGLTHHPHKAQEAVRKKCKAFRKSRVSEKGEGLSAASLRLRERWKNGGGTEGRREIKERLVHQGAPNLLLAIFNMEHSAGKRNQKASDRCRLFGVNSFCSPVLHHLSPKQFEYFPLETKSLLTWSKWKFALTPVSLF